MVEFAVVAPLAFLTLFSAIEFGRLLLVMHGIEETAREACRLAVVRTSTYEQVVERIGERLSTFGVSRYSAQITPDPPSTADQWQPISVQVQVAYSEVSWLPAPRFLAGIMLTGSCTLPQEADKRDGLL